MPVLGGGLVKQVKRCPHVELLSEHCGELSVGFVRSSATAQLGVLGHVTNVTLRFGLLVYGANSRGCHKN